MAFAVDDLLALGRKIVTPLLPKRKLMVPLKPHVRAPLAATITATTIPEPPANAFDRRQSEHRTSAIEQVREMREVAESARKSMSVDGSVRNSLGGLRRDMSPSTTSPVRETGLGCVDEEKTMSIWRRGQGRWIEDLERGKRR